MYPLTDIKKVTPTRVFGNGSTYSRLWFVDFDSWSEKNYRWELCVKVLDYCKNDANCLALPVAKSYSKKQKLLI